MTAITVNTYSSSKLGAQAATSAVLYQRNATNILNATAADATNIGTLTTNLTQLNVTGQVTSGNQDDYYNFTLQGNSLKADFTNITNTTGLRVQITDATGTVIADNQGTPAQQTAFTELSLSTGLTANPGVYTAKISYAPTALTGTAQSYNLSLYSGSTFYSSYATTAAAQTKASTYVPVDNTQTFQTSDAQSYSRNAYHTIGETVGNGVNLGWLYEDKSALSVDSQVTNADSSEYYQVTLQKGSDLKLAFNNTTDTSKLDFQLYDATGTTLLADNHGTLAQQAAFAKLTSSTGLAAKPGAFSIKVSYAQGADRTKTQNYNFQLYSGTYYTTKDATTASAESYGHAVLTGNTAVVGYSSASATAAYLTNLSNGNSTDLISALTAFV